MDTTWKHLVGLNDPNNQPTPEQKREYLRILFSEDRAAAQSYLEQKDCAGGTFIYRSREEAETFQRHLEKCCTGAKSEQLFFIPEKRAVAFQPEKEHPFITFFP